MNTHPRTYWRSGANGHRGARFRDGKPVGLQSVPARAHEALEMLARGMTRREVAEHFGVSRSAVTSWIAAFRAAIEDAESRRT